MKNADYLIDPDEVANLIHHNVESGFSHTTYREELERFAYLENGDERAVEGSVKLMNADVQGRLSEDPLRNYKYLFIINTGLATRVVIEAGVTQELVYSISDVYIRKADEATTIDEVKELNRELWKRYVRLVRDIRKRGSYSKPVQDCINYITSHFNTKITLKDLANATGLTPNYLASVFKRDTGMTVGEYLLNFRIDSAKALLTKTDYSYLQIALSLGFCTQSYFTQVFREQTGITPKEYRLKFVDKTFSDIN